MGQRTRAQAHLPSPVHTSAELWSSAAVVVEVVLHVHRNRRLIRARTGAQDVHLDFHTAPELCLVIIAIFIAIIYANGVCVHWSPRER